MASKHTHIIQATSKGFGKTKKEVKGLSGSMKKFAAGLVSAAVAYKAFGVAFDSIKLAGKLEGVEKGFKNMSKEAGFSVGLYKKLDKALNGTADKMTVMTQANNAMLLGIAGSEDQMADMFDVAQRLAQAVGQDATFGIESLVTGLGRQSKLMLDNLGIMVDTNKAYENYAEELGTTVEKLTDAEKKQGFINAAMKEGKNLVKKVGKENLTTSQKMDQFTTSITNFKTAIGEALIESGVLGQMVKFSDKIVAMANSWTTAKKEVEAFTHDEKMLMALIKTENEILTDLTHAQTQLNLADQEYAKGSGFKLGWVKKSTEAYAKNSATAKANAFVTSMMEKTGRTEAELRELISAKIVESTRILGDHNAELVIEKENKSQRLKDIEDELEAERKRIALAKEVEDAKIKAAEDEKKRHEAFKKLTKEATKVGLQAASGEKTMAQASLDAAKIQMTSSLKVAIAKMIEENTKLFAWMGPAAPVVIAAISAGAATMFQQQIDRLSVGAQTGFEGVVSEPTTFTVGEGGADEYVSVTPLEGVNNAGEGGQGITVNISGNVMSEQFVEEELAERIQEAVRKGISFGIS